MPHQGDALIIVDVQIDFLPGGKLAVPEGDAVVLVLNDYIKIFQNVSLPVFASRDWHPPDHCSFKQQGGSWPPHCIAGTSGADFAAKLELPNDARIISKATSQDRDAYSGFEGTDLDRQLRALGVQRLFVGGLATDVCVLNTVKDGVAHGYSVMLLADAIRAVNIKPDDGSKALAEMKNLGAVAITLSQVP